ncbi:amidase family protein [Oenococcus kitaharae]|uniref:amidase family protein n=1 Tax=Oenococcus TaxID=46254 RepID=UPI0021E79F69|nr:amidase family protein [Oenococcus kitaharae]MCV3296145.1 amidase family protein [Oenococcus kitaharae]
MFTKSAFFEQIKSYGLSRHEKEMYWRLLDGSFLNSFKAVSSLDDLPPMPPQKRYARSYEVRPFEKSDPFNAWTVKTHIDHAVSGSLVNKKIAVKDNIAIANVPMSIGTDLMASFKPKEDATVIMRLLDHGAQIIGKAVSESLFSAGNSYTADSGPVQNPKAIGYSAGGSSSGSAALVASHEVDAALGCDQTGSIRIPSALCGIYGFKPSRGLVPYTGIVSVDQLLDSVGPMANTVGDLALVLDAIAGRDGLDATQAQSLEAGNFHFFQSLSANIAGKRLGLLQQGFAIDHVSDPEVDKTVRINIDCFKKAGVSISQSSLPEFDLGNTIADVINTIGTSRQLIQFGGDSTSSATYYPADISEAIKNRINTSNFHKLAPIVQGILYSGQLADSSEINYYGRARNLMPAVTAAFEKAFEAVDILALPTVPFMADKLPENPASLNNLFMNRSGVGINCGVFNLIGYPAINIPCQVTSLPRPVGMMLVAPFRQDQLLLDFANTYEKLTA